MENLPQRIVDEASLMQCVFWIAFDQTPLFGDHEDLRVNMRPSIYPKSSYDTKEAHRIEAAKDELILYLSEGRITATGYEGYPAIDEKGYMDTSCRCNISHAHWRSDLTDRNWEDGTLHSAMSGSQITFTVVQIPTIDLFKTFPHRDMESVLVGHENKDAFLERLTLTAAGRRPRPPGEPKPATIAGRKEASEAIDAAIKILGGNCTKKRASEYVAQELGMTPSAIARKRRHYQSYLKRQNGNKSNKRSSISITH